MHLDLHRAVRNSCREAMAQGSTSRRSFDPAVDLVRANAPEPTPRRTRRLVTATPYRAPGAFPMVDAN
jgi:hypothetical protein